jgi:hypothetical protein
MVANCIGNEMGRVVVPSGVCVEPKFGLAFTANGTYARVRNTCDSANFQTEIRCDAGSGCCQVPGVTVSMNITESYLEVSKNETRPGYQYGSPLPKPSAGRTFVCTEQLI